MTHAGVAAVLSFVFNGMGQLYNGQIKKGLWIIFLSSLSLMVFLIGSILLGLWLLGKDGFPGSLIWGLILLPAGLILICVLGIYSILDAHKVAKTK